MSVFLSRAAVQVRQWLTAPGRRLSVSFTPVDVCDGFQLTATLQRVAVMWISFQYKETQKEVSQD